MSAPWQCQRPGSALVKLPLCPVKWAAPSELLRAQGCWSFQRELKRKVQSCTESFAIPVQGAFKLYCISTVSLGLRLQINEKHKSLLE